jgi:thiamine-phosphate pyrophosphorylase
MNLLDKLGVYLVTDRGATGGRPLVDVVERALRGGVRAVQLRERGLEARALLDIAAELRALTARHDALLLINDRIDVALACGADGVHLPSHSFTVRDARTLLGTERLIGLSTHHPAEVARAAEDGADFTVFGPVFDTPSKRALGAPVGLDGLAAAAAAVTPRATAFPVLAIGGVTAAEVPAARRHGAAGVAVIRAILAADDVEAAARALCAAGRSP